MGYIGMCRCEGYGIQAVYINQNVWVQNRVSFFRKLISWLKILSRLGKQLPQDRGNLGKKKKLKIQLNQLWYRLRVTGSQGHIPTQKFLKYALPPPPPGDGSKGPKPSKCTHHTRNIIDHESALQLITKIINFEKSRGNSKKGWKCYTAVTRL